MNKTIKRLLLLGTNITARTLLTMKYVREGWPTGKLTPRQRRAVETAIIVWQHYPSMCLRLRRLHQREPNDMMKHYLKTYTTAVQHIERQQAIEGDWAQSDEVSSVSPELFNKLLSRSRFKIDGRGKY